MSQSLQDRAVALESIGRWADALELYVQLSDNEPSNDFARCRIATALRQLERYEEAESAARSAIQAFPNSYRAYNALGLVLEGMGRAFEAYEAYSQATALNPHIAVLFRNLADVARSVGDHDAARRAVARAIELDPGNPNCYAVAGNVERAAGNFAAAEQLLELGLAIAPQSTDLHFLLAAVSDDVGDWARSIERYRTTLLLDPTDKWAPGALLNAMIREQLTLDRPNDARVIVDEYLEFFLDLEHDDSGSSGIVDHALWAARRCFVVLRQYDDALDVLERQLLGLRSNAHTPFTRVTLAGQLRCRAKYLNMLDRHDEAIETAHEALEVARRVAEEAPLAYGDCLQEGLSGLAQTLAAAGRIEEAAEVAAACVRACRDLAEGTQRDHHLMWALCQLSDRRAALADFADAVATNEEAVAICRRQYERHPSPAAERRYADELAHQAQHLLAAGRVDEAHRCSLDALETLRRLVTPIASERHWLDDQLICHAKVLAAVGDSEGAVDALNEAIASLETLVRRHVPVSTSDRATSPDSLQTWLDDAIATRGRIKAE